MVARNPRGHRADDLGDFMRQRTAVGIAQHHPARSRLIGGLDARQRILRIGFVAVEEVLGVEHHLVDAPERDGDAVADHAEVFVQLHAERDLDLMVPGLADQGDDLGGGGEQRLESRIVVGAAAGAPRHAEGGEARMAQFGRVREELVVGGVGAGPAALDVVDAEAVEFGGDCHLVGGGEVHALGLCAVAQGAVVQINPFAVHWSRSIIVGNR